MCLIIPPPFAYRCIKCKKEFCFLSVKSYHLCPKCVEEIVTKEEQRIEEAKAKGEPIYKR